MKLVRFGAPGAEKPGIIDADGVVRDLSQHVTDITGDTLAPASLDKLRQLDPRALPAAPAGVRLGPPVGRVANFIAVGLNYIDHAKETGVEIPKGSLKLDYEVEIAFVVGRRARYVAESEALSYIAGYTICNDVSERNF